jgi:hypothetical protein
MTIYTMTVHVIRVLLTLQCLYVTRARLTSSVYSVDVLERYCACMCPPTKRSRVAKALPSVIVKHLVRFVPHDTYLYLYKADRDPVCAQQSLYGACSQCDAARIHAAKMWQCLRKIRSPGHDEAGRSHISWVQACTAADTMRLSLLQHIQPE